LTKILITGGAGFIGSSILKNKKFSKFNLKVIDRFFFGQNLIKKYKKVKFIKNDIRDLKVTDFKNIDIVLDLAALSNDPSCELDTKLTYDINYKGRVNCAINAKKAGVKKYIFMSSCSVYGKNTKRNLDEISRTDPVSEYAKASLNAESKIKKISDKKFQVTILRNATVYGLSDRMRFDLVVNLMTASSFYEKKIYILGGGEQIRPLVCVEDVTEYLYEICNSKQAIYANQIFNIGKENLKVIDIAKKIKKALNNNTQLIIVPDDNDKRNYHINFSKAEKAFKFKPKHSIESEAKKIYEKLDNGLITKDIKSSTINWYRHLLESKKLVDEVQHRGKIF
jgi:nucleoside-diphosphate-sugar epimerase